MVQSLRQISVSLFCFAVLLQVTGCAQSEERSVSTSRTETCTNGVCTRTSTETTTVTRGGSAGVGVSDGSAPIGTDGGIVTMSVSGATGSIPLTPCEEKNAPLSACALTGLDVLSPKHLGCTATGAHVWSCQDTFSGPPPYNVVACSGVFSDSCSKIGKIY